MVAHLIEFATNHYILVGIFVVLLALLLVHTMQGGGRSLSTAELTALVNKDAGVVVDIRPGKEFEQLASNKLDGQHMASPAVFNESLLLRTNTHLYRIGK